MTFASYHLHHCYGKLVLDLIILVCKLVIKSASSCSKSSSRFTQPIYSYSTFILQLKTKSRTRFYHNDFYISIVVMMCIVSREKMVTSKRTNSFFYFTLVAIIALKPEIIRCAKNLKNFYQYIRNGIPLFYGLLHKK